MTITKSLVEKIHIVGLPNPQNINVFFEDYDEGRGKVTIEADGDAWSFFWGATGRATIKEFFAKAGTDYLCRKFSIGIESTIDDESQEALQLAARKYVIKLRKSLEYSKKFARQAFDRIEDIDDCGIESNHSALCDIFGDEWWSELPQIPNPEYNHLALIVNTIKEALKSENEG